MNKKQSPDTRLMHFNQLFCTIFSLMLIVLCSQVSHADTGITIKKAKKDKDITAYSAPSSSKKIDESIPASKVNNISVIEDAMNGRFLKINVDGKHQWIKAKHVITSQVYDVGACEKQNKSTGTRAAVNCTE